MRDYTLPDYHYVFGGERDNKVKLTKILHNDGDGEIHKYILNHIDLFVLAICEKYGYSMRIIVDEVNRKMIHAYAVKRFLGETYYYDQTGMVEFESFREFFKNKKVLKENCKVYTIGDLEKFKTTHRYYHDKRKGLGFINRKIHLMKCYMEHTFKIVEPFHYEAYRILDRAGWGKLKTFYGKYGQILITGKQNYLNDEYEIKTEVFKDIYYGMLTYYEVYKNGELIRSTTLRRYLELEEEMSSWMSIHNQEKYVFGVQAEHDEIKRLLGE